MKVEPAASPGIKSVGSKREPVEQTVLSQFCDREMSPLDPAPVNPRALASASQTGNHATLCAFRDVPLKEQQQLELVVIRPVNVPQVLLKRRHFQHG